MATNGISIAHVPPGHQLAPTTSNVCGLTRIITQVHERVDLAVQPHSGVARVRRAVRTARARGRHRQVDSLQWRSHIGRSSRSTQQYSGDYHVPSYVGLYATTSRYHVASKCQAPPSCLEINFPCWRVGSCTTAACPETYDHSTDIYNFYLSEWVSNVAHTQSLSGYRFYYYDLLHG